MVLLGKPLQNVRNDNYPTVILNRVNGHSVSVQCDDRAVHSYRYLEWKLAQELRVA